MIECVACFSANNCRQVRLAELYIDEASKTPDVRAGWRILDLEWVSLFSISQPSPQTRSLLKKGVDERINRLAVCARRENIYTKSEEAESLKNLVLLESCSSVSNVSSIARFRFFFNSKFFGTVIRPSSYFLWLYIFHNVKASPSVLVVFYVKTSIIYYEPNIFIENNYLDSL